MLIVDGMNEGNVRLTYGSGTSLAIHECVKFGTLHISWRLLRGDVIMGNHRLYVAYNATPVFVNAIIHGRL